jgi:hypothetical protein
MSSIIALKGKKITKSVKFNGGSIEISKLTIAQVFEIRKLSEEATPESDPLQIPKMLIRMSASGGNELSDADFEDFPLDDVNALSEEIMMFSGLKDKNKGNA